MVQLNENKTGSVLSKTIHQTVVGETPSDEVGMHLNVGQLNLILNIFNNFGIDKLGEALIEELRPILPDALKAALNGVYRWWQYVNNDACPIPRWLLDEKVRLCPIWIEDREVVEES